MSPRDRYWYHHMVPANLRWDQGHFGREIHKWRVNGNFNPVPAVNVCQTITSAADGSKKTTSSVFRGKSDIRRVRGERYWTNLKGPLLTHGEQQRTSADNVTLAYSANYNELIKLLGKRSLNLNEDNFLHHYEEHTGNTRKVVREAPQSLLCHSSPPLS